MATRRKPTLPDSSTPIELVIRAARNAGIRFNVNDGRLHFDHVPFRSARLAVPLVQRQRQVVRAMLPYAHQA